MMFILTWTLALALALQLSLAVAQYDRPVPNLPVPDNKLKIANASFRRFIHSTPKLTATFDIDRFLYNPCAASPGETIIPQHECGIKSTMYPSIRCSSWQDRHEEGLSDEISVEGEDQEGTELYTCHTYRTGNGYDTRPLSKAEKKWLRFRLVDFKENTTVPNPEGKGFQSVQIHFINAAPIVE
jgi:hypothetical protein